MYTLYIYTFFYFQRLQKNGYAITERTATHRARPRRSIHIHICACQARALVPTWVKSVGRGIFPAYTTNRIICKIK